MELISLKQECKWCRLPCYRRLESASDNDLIVNLDFVYVNAW